MEISRIQEKQKKLLFDRKKLLHSRNRSKSFTVKNEIYDHTSVNICERIDEINRVFQSTLVLTKNKNFKMGKIFNLKNLILRFYITIWFYYSKNVFSVMIKRFIIFYKITITNF